MRSICAVGDESSKVGVSFKDLGNVYGRDRSDATQVHHRPKGYRKEAPKK